jgi:hypothetical protein
VPGALTGISETLPRYDNFEMEVWHLMLLKRRNAATREYVPARNRSSFLAFYYLFFREKTMGTLIEHILQVFGKKIEPDGTEETLLDFLSKKPGTEERTRAVEEVDFLKDLRT